MAIKIVGALLITAILIIPAAAARALSRTPESMAVTAALTGICAVIGGLAVSFQWDTPTGPTMVVVAVALFALSSLVPAVSRGR